MLNRDMQAAYLAIEGCY